MGAVGRVLSMVITLLLELIALLGTKWGQGRGSLTPNPKQFS